MLVYDQARRLREKQMVRTLAGPANKKNGQELLIARNRQRRSESHNLIENQQHNLPLTLSGFPDFKVPGLIDGQRHGKSHKIDSNSPPATISEGMCLECLAQSQVSNLLQIKPFSRGVNIGLT